MSLVVLVLNDQSIGKNTRIHHCRGNSAVFGFLCSRSTNVHISSQHLIVFGFALKTADSSTGKYELRIQKLIYTKCTLSPIKQSNEVPTEM